MDGNGPFRPRRKPIFSQSEFSLWDLFKVSFVRDELLSRIRIKQEFLDLAQQEMELDRANETLGGWLWPVDVSSRPALPGPNAALPGERPTLEPASQDREIEREALKGVIEFSRQPAGEAQAAWSAWTEEIRATWPSFAAEEIVEQAKRLRDLLV